MFNNEEKFDNNDNNIHYEYSCFKTGLMNLNNFLIEVIISPDFIKNDIKNMILPNILNIMYLN
jgi:hypothetical protein